MDHFREKVSQLFLVGLQGETLAADERLLIEEYGFGGFLLFKRNCREAGQVLSLCRALWTMSLEPPFIAIDQEGGRVHRLPPPFSHFPTAAAIGKKSDPNLAYSAGHATAAELRLAGMNLNLAPVLDVNASPDNPIIGDRAFGADPQTVTAISGPWIQGLKDGGVIPCGKHFPGHGATDKDSHWELPVVEKSLAELQAAELPPFIHACRNNIEALMTAHVVYPALDPQWPATLSEKIVTGLLRQQMGYRGVVFSDDMGMKAISDRHGVEEAAFGAVRAGVDMLLFCHELSIAARACEFLCMASERNAALRARIDESHARVAKLKSRFLESFTGVAENDLVERLARLAHGRIIEQFYGNL